MIVFICSFAWTSMTLLMLELLSEKKTVSPFHLIKSNFPFNFEKVTDFHLIIQKGYSFNLLINPT